MERQKILISDAVAETCADRLRGQGFEVDYAPGLDARDLPGRIADCQGLIVRSATKVTAELLTVARNLKVVGRAGTGVDNIDVPRATELGVAVVNSRGANTISAAEHTFALMISLARRIPAAHMSLVSGEWRRSAFVGVELFDKRLGIIGLGQIGREVAKRAQAFGMTVVAFDPLVAAADFETLGVGQETIDTILANCDFVTLHLPINEQTRHLISDAQFAACKPGISIINVARGGVVDEPALHRAIESGRVAGAALDVFEAEPPKDNPLIGHPAVVTTPHLGASTVDAQARVATEIADNVADYLSGAAVNCLVNPEVK